MKASLVRQNGHAALLFALMIPAFFAVFILASDGARALQSKARLEDASEVAVLAIAAHNVDADADEIAAAYIRQYMSDMGSLKELKIIKKNCEQIDDCKNREADQPRFFQYAIQTKTEHFSWFPNDDGVAGFGEKFTVAGSATARKFQSEAVDVMFVTDFSTSMLRGWRKDESRIKIADLKKVLLDILNELKKFNDLSNGQNNTVGNVSFNDLTRSKMPSSQDTDCVVSQLIWKDDGYEYKFMNGDWYRLEEHLHWYGWDWDWYRVNRKNVDYEETVKEIFTAKNKCQGYNYGLFHDIELTDKFSSFNDKVNYFSPRGNTASYEGVIRGAQLLKKGKNARRLLIVLSDGRDNNTSLSTKLVTAGMCSKIKTELNKGFTEGGKKIKARLAVIGIDYEVEENKALQDCVGAGNVYSAKNKDQIRNKILELISEEIGHLK